MFYYIDQPCTPSFPIGLVKTKLDFIGSSNLEVSPSAGKNTLIVFSAMLRMELCPYSYFWWCGYF